MLSNEKKIDLCEEILKNKIFQKSPKSSALLRYLVKSTIAGDHLKEDIIDFEFFGSKSDFSRNNPRVRVNMYNLRKKLTEYYLNDGQNSSWKLCIDKGQYSVRFEKKKIGKSFVSEINPKQLIPYFMILLLIFILFYSKVKPEPNKIWKPLLENEKSSTVIIGDVFGMVGSTIAGSSGWTRVYNINTINDYLLLISEKPELKKTIKPSDYSYTTSMGAFSIQNLTEFYLKYGSTFDIRFSSNTSVADLKKGNLIYVGPIRNKNKFISLFNDSNPYFNIIGNKLIFNNHPTLEKKTFYPDGRSINGKDFSIVSRFTGPKNNEYFLFFSNHDIGVKATIEKFTNHDSIADFSKKHLKNHKNFTALFRAYGKERTNLNLETLMVVPFK